MASNIARAGVELTVFDTRAGAVDELVGLGARRAGSVAEVAASVDVLCTCVLYDHQVREIFLADDGILANAKPGLVATIHSTVPPATIEDIVAAANGRVKIVDAPVSGASTGSKAGTLTLMVGASDEALALAAPVFELVAEHVIHVGAPGMGQIAKLGNNIMALGNQLIAMEAVRFADAFGLDRERLFEVAAVSTGASWAAENYAHFDRYGVEHTLAGTPELPHRLGKDLRYVVAVAQERWTYLPLTALGSQLLPEMYRARWAANAEAANAEAANAEAANAEAANAEAASEADSGDRSEL
jgi:3-hydroxyisobutyrate dehydrogenase-like beta-hydroxyacid dehydrogenase